MIVIHHNPDCGNSRNVLRIIEAAGYSPVVIDYLQEGWTRPQLLGLLAASNLTPRGALRETKSPAQKLGLLEESTTDEQLFEAMLQYPVLVNRPIVCTPKGVRLCRPCETVLELLDQWPSESFTKEDGDPIVDSDGKRIR
ncbi:MAG: arsenate reductase (glutaredoxin) [Gammaproteobacteria bacterium]|nr:arsenate reductase (glutaredoxin) [Gammaproteobacteria bacterium]